jgi:hypothetical protein
MRKIIAPILSSIILILAAVSQPSWTAASQCPRRCLTKVFADERYNAGMNEIIRSFQEAAKTEYFSFVYWDDFEYLLSVEYQIFEDGISVPGWETDAQGRRRIVDKGPYRSLLLMGLWFVGGKTQDQGPGYGRFQHNFVILLESWSSWSEETDPLTHKAAILSQIQATPPLHEIAWDYEQMPVTIEMEPEKECVEYGEEIKIDMKNFKDKKGRPTTKYFNRFVFTTERGEIQLFGEHKIGEKEWADSITKAYHQYKAPSAEECGNCDEDTITAYNSCDVLHPDVYPYSRTRKREKIFELKIDIGCDWEGTIASAFSMNASGDESLLTALMPKSSYRGATNWKLDVVFEIDRGNERVRIYRLKSARFDFLDQLDGDVVLNGEAVKTQITGKDQAETRGRNLSRSECDLELIIDLKKKTYKIEGLLYVQNISEKGKGELKVDAPPIRHDEKDTDSYTTEYKEEILIEGKFKEESPVKLEGSKDEIKELPPDFVEFMEALAGNVTGKIRWTLERKGKK